MDGQQWAWWCEFFELEPWGGRQDDFRAAWPAVFQYNAWRGKNVKALEPDDLFQSLKVVPGAQKRQMPLEQYWAWLSWAAASGAKIESLPTG